VIHVDDGCKTALREKGTSLLAPGVVRCDGKFAEGEVVRVCDANGTEFARGIVRCGAEEAAAARSSGKSIVIHRDDLVLL
jgi:glutamate 5-kinase